jgi:hypothetical protein
MAHKKHSRRRYGGKHKKGGASYSSAASYSEYVNGTEDAQYGRVFSQSGPYANIPGNISIGAQGQNSNMYGAPNAQQLALIQKAGKRGSRRKRGGIWGSIINQAVVPFSLLGLQQSYGRKKYDNMQTRRRKYRG